MQVVDGDTLDVEHEDGTVNKIRLANIDAPELAQEGGQEAKDALESLVQGKMSLEKCQSIYYL